MTGTTVTVEFTSVVVTVTCPHEAVDTETILDAAHKALGDGVCGQIVIPRWNGRNQKDGPEFEVFTEVREDPEIEDDDRTEKPEEFEPTLRWWKETGGKD